MAPDIAPDGEAIAQARRSRGLTQRALANLAEVSERTLRRIERGEAKTLDTQAIRSLADALGVKVEAITVHAAEDTRLARLLDHAEQAFERFDHLLDRLERLLARRGV